MPGPPAEIFVLLIKAVRPAGVGRGRRPEGAGSREEERNPRVVGMRSRGVDIVPDGDGDSMERT